MLGHGPGRWGITNGFILSFVTGIYFDSISSQWAMGLLRLMVVLGGFFSGDGRRRGGQLRMVHEDSRGNIVFSCFLGVFVKFGRDSCLCIHYVRVCIRTLQCMFINK
jgi:hypothetical protein